MHALHNADLIRQTLPRHHYAPQYYLRNREQSHQEFAANARTVGTKKRAEAAAKAAATCARKKDGETIQGDKTNAQEEVSAERDENRNDPESSSAESGEEENL